MPHLSILCEVQHDVSPHRNLMGPHSAGGTRDFVAGCNPTTKVTILTRVWMPLNWGAIFSVNSKESFCLPSVQIRFFTTSLAFKKEHIYSIIQFPLIGSCLLCHPWFCTEWRFFCFMSWSVVVFLSKQSGTLKLWRMGAAGGLGAEGSMQLWIGAGDRSESETFN